MPIDPNNPPDDFRSVLASVGRDGRRRWLFVDIAMGSWRRRRIIFSFFLIAFFMSAPFISINGAPFILIDIPNRHYFIFGQLFWPQDIPYFVLFVIMTVIGTFALVSLLGRVFCGWLCPHNVFLEMVFRPIEQLFEGRGHKRAIDSQKSMTTKRLIRKIGKWIAYMLLAGALANTATAVFVGTDAFIWGLFIDPIEHRSAAIFFAMFFAALMFNFTWFREQTCTIVCPYGRLQAAMLDADTLSVSYDYQRGEPRGKKSKKEPEKEVGDCVNCGRCLQVCPTGIDIRNGNQMECIHCTACIDACDTVMEKLKRPKGLIRFASENTIAGKPSPKIRPRTFIYIIVLIGLGILTTVKLSYRTDVAVTLLRSGPNANKRMVDEDGSVSAMRTTQLTLINKTLEEITTTISLPEGVPGRVSIPELVVPVGEPLQTVLEVIIPYEAFEGKTYETTLEFSYPTKGGGVESTQISLSLLRPKR